MELEKQIEATQIQLDQMWDKIQELKSTDEFAAGIMYAKYKQISESLPPIPSNIVEDQARI